MTDTNDILKKASAHVRMLLNEKLPSWALYHNYEHTAETVEACEEIGEGCKLSRSETEIAQLAAWFHDAGYTEAVDGHEEAGATIAREFLSAQGYPPERTDSVAGAILATKVPQKPQTLVEQVVCDADMAHLGRKKFFEKSNLLRLEIERRTGSLISDVDWINTNVEFVARHQYHTAYAKQEFSNRRMKNLAQLQELLRDSSKKAEGQNAKLELKKEKLEKEKRPERGIETMFRTVPHNHLNLSAMADNKANLMISTNSIIISIVFGLLVSKLDTNPHLVLPTLLLLAVCLTAMVFAILTTRPTITTGMFTREDIEQKRANLLFFGNFYNTKLEDFEWGMKEMMRDSDYLYSAMIKDLYFLGKVLGKKYRYLRISYNIFMYGLILAVIAFILAFLNAPPTTL